MSDASTTGNLGESPTSRIPDQEPVGETLTRSPDGADVLTAERT